MTTRIYKYKLAYDDRTAIFLPKGFIIRHVGTQDNTCYIWVEINPAVVRNKQIFIEIFGTGQDIPSDMGVERSFLGTVQCDNGLVWHIFRRLF